MPWPQTRRLMGTKIPRVDGPDKATGRAKYSFDINRPGMLHAKILRCPHAHATVRAINTAACSRLPGFRALHIVHDVGRELFYAGAEVIAIAADTEEHANDCLRAIQVEYQVLPFLVMEVDAFRALAQNQAGTVPGPNNPPNISIAGEFQTANFNAAAFRNVVGVEGAYSLPVICHQCFESRGLVAEWDEELQNLTVWCSTQAVPGTAIGLAQALLIPATRVRVITEYLGGGFGSKLGPEVQGIAAAQLARRARAPVKLMLDRAEEVSTGGSRPSVFGVVRIGGNNNGIIQGFEIDCHGSPGIGGEATAAFDLLPYVYPVTNVRRRHRIVRLNTQTAKPMRGATQPQSCYLTECAVDDLAAQMNANPIELRLRNLPPNDANAIRTAPTSWGAIRNTVYREQIAIARRLSGWDNKWHAPGRGEGAVVKRGIGMALHTWDAGGGPNNDVRVTINPDGSVLVTCSMQDLGGPRTVLAIVVAEVVGLQPGDITVRSGDSAMGRSTPSGDSTTTPGIAPAAYNAAIGARDALFAALAVRLHGRPENLAIYRGQVINLLNNESMSWQQACAQLNMDAVAHSGNWTPGLSNQGVGGVQVAEVKVDTETGVVTMLKFVAVQECGMIVNKQGCESQVAGGVIMGLNYALYEERIMDRATGRQVNPNMEFYKLAGINDIPPIVVHMMDMPERGVIGIGDPPIVSTAAAVGNAIFNALGVRVGHAPFTPDRVLIALAAANAQRN